MPKFFVEPFKIGNDKIIVDTDDVLHITKALRYREGDVITVCDGRKNDYICSILSLSKERIECDILERRANLAEPSIDLTLFLALPKGDKADFVIQKSVELGASHIVLFESENSVAKAPRDERSLSKKLEKWRKTSLEAAKQCGRGIIPSVEGIFSFEEALDRASVSQYTLFLYEKEGETSLADFDWERAEDVSLIVGPEGGFSEAEVLDAEESGACPVTLGKRILRLETAAVSAVAVIMYITHNL